MAGNFFWILCIAYSLAMGYPTSYLQGEGAPLVNSTSNDAMDSWLYRVFKNFICFRNGSSLGVQNLTDTDSTQLPGTIIFTSDKGFDPFRDIPFLAGTIKEKNKNNTEKKEITHVAAASTSREKRSLVVLAPIARLALKKYKLSGNDSSAMP